MLQLIQQESVPESRVTKVDLQIQRMDLEWKIKELEFNLRDHESDQESHQTLMICKSIFIKRLLEIEKENLKKLIAGINHRN